MRVVQRTIHIGDGASRNYHIFNLWAIIRKQLSMDFSFSDATCPKSVLEVGIYCPPPPWAPWHQRILEEIKIEFDLRWLEIKSCSYGADYYIDADKLKLWHSDLQHFAWLEGKHRVIPTQHHGGQYFKDSPIEMIECGGTSFRIEEP